MTIVNSGQTAYNDAAGVIHIAEVLDDAFYNGDGTTTSGVVTFDPVTSELTWTGNLAVGMTATFVSSVTVNDPDTGSTVVTAVATSTEPGNNCPAGSPDPRCVSTVDVLIPVLTIVKTPGVTAPIPGQVVPYTITVANDGEVPYVGISVVDSLAGLVDDADYNSDASATGGLVTFVSPDLTWSGDLAIGATVTVTYSVTVHYPDVGNRQLDNEVSSTAPGSSCPPAGGDPDCRSVLGVLVPELTLVKSADATGVTAGDTVAYTFTITNSGQTPYQSISVADDLTDVLDDATFNDDATATAGSVSHSGDILTWTGDAAVGAAVTVRYSVTVSAPDPGDRTMTNTLSSAAVGSNCPVASTDVRCSITVTVLQTALEIVVAADAASVVEGGTVHYTITLTNTGESPYVDLLVTNVLAGVLDDAAYNDDAAATTGTIGFTSPDLTWFGNLAPTDVVTITYSVTVDVPAGGDASLVSVVSSAAAGSSCPPPGTAAGCTATTSVVPLTLTLTDLTPAFGLAGSPATTVVNNGAVTMTVATNSPTGYVVTVQAGADQLVPNVPGAPSGIPIANVHVRETGTTLFQPLSDTEPVRVHSQPGPSGPEGDALSK